MVVAPVCEKTNARLWASACGALLLLLLGGRAVEIWGSDLRRVPLPDNPHALDPNRACGTYCLMFLNAYFGGQQSYAEIVRLCPPGPRGTSLLEVKSAAERLGLHSAGVRISTAQLKQLDVPAILHLDSPDGVHHFVVWLGWDTQKEAAYLFSPPKRLAFEPIKVIESRFSGLALLVSREPIPAELRVKAEPPRALLWLWSGALVFCCLVFLRMLTTGRRPPRATARIAIGVLALALASWLPGCTTPEPPRAEPTFDERRTVDLGDVKRGAELTHVFTIRNTGDEPFEITGVVKSCTCELTDVHVGDVVQPNDVVQISYKVPTRDARGRVTGRLVLKTNSPEASLRQILLTLNANVVAKLRAIPPQLAFGMIRGKDSPAKTLRVESVVPGLIERFKQVSPDDRNLHAELVEQTPGALVFRVSVSPQAPEGDLHGIFSFEFDDKDYPVLLVDVLARKVGPLAIIPREILLTPFVKDEAQVFHVRVVSTVGGEFRITGLECPDNVTVEWSDDEPRNAFDLRVSVAEPPQGERETRIVVNTDRFQPVTCPMRPPRQIHRRNNLLPDSPQ